MSFPAAESNSSNNAAVGGALAPFVFVNSLPPLHETEYGRAKARQEQAALRRVLSRLNIEAQQWDKSDLMTPLQIARVDSRPLELTARIISEKFGVVKLKLVLGLDWPMASPTIIVTESERPIDHPMFDHSTREFVGVEWEPVFTIGAFLVALQIDIVDADNQKLFPEQVASGIKKRKGQSSQAAAARKSRKHNK